MTVRRYLTGFHEGNGFRRDLGQTDDSPGLVEDDDGLVWLVDQDGAQTDLTAVTAASGSWQLAAATVVGATTVRVRAMPNTIQVGAYVGVSAGTTSCEVRRVTAVSGLTLTLHSALKATHAKGDNVWLTPGFWIPFEWWGARAGVSSFDSYRSVVNAMLDQSSYGLIGRQPSAYYLSRPIFSNDYTALANVKFAAMNPFAIDCTIGDWDGIPNQYLWMLAGQFGTATFNAGADTVTMSVNPGSAQYSDVQFFPRPGATMPDGIEEGRRYFTITGNNVTSQLTLSQGDPTPVDITSAGAGEIVVVSTGLARLFARGHVMFDGSQTKGLNGLIALVQQPSDMDSIRVENFPVVGMTLGAQQGRIGNLMIFDCWTGLELAGAEMVYLPAGNVESCDIQIDFAETTRNPPGSTANRGVVIGDGFHMESPGRGPSQVQTLVPSATLTSGTFQLRFKNQTTAALNWNASAAQVESALEALSTVGDGNVACTLLTGTNLSDGLIRCDFTVGTLKWEFWEGSTNATTGGEMAVLNSTLAGGTLSVSYLSPNGRNISYKVGVGNRIAGVSMGGSETVNGVTPYFLEFEGTAVDSSQGKFQGVTLEDVIFFNQNTGVVHDSLNGITLTSNDTTGCGQFLAYFERPGRHAGNVGKHWWFVGDGGRLIQMNTAGASTLDLTEASGQTDAMLHMAGFAELDERSDAAAPAANKVRVYARDTGGKTELVARFPTGAIQRLAIEP